MRMQPTGRPAVDLAPCGAALLAGAYVAAMWAWHPLVGAFEIDPDEGINAMKALLLAHGHPLYVEVWSDQPPLFTYLLRGWLALFGWDLAVGRGLVLLSAGLIVFAVTDLVRQAAGWPAGLAAAALLCSDAYFQTFSLALMVGLPSLAGALLGLWMIARWRTDRRAAWLPLAGACLGAALGIKLMTVFLVPIAAAALAGAARAWRPLALWGAGLAAALLASAALIGGEGWSQLYAPHLDARAAFAATGSAMLEQTLRHDWTLVALAALGLLAARRPPLAVFAAWLAVATPMLIWHAPYWAHHYLLLVLPLCALGGAALGLTRGRRWPWQGAAALALAAVIAVRLDGRQPYPWTPDVSERTGQFVVEVMRHYADRTTRVFTDRGAFAFRAGVQVPPALAVISVKRFAGGALAPAAVAEALSADPPQQIVLTDRLPAVALDRLAALLAERYRPVFARTTPAQVRLFVRGDLAGDPLDALVAAAVRVPDSAAGHDQIGLRWAARGEPRRALAAFRRAHAVDPADGPAAQHLADALMAEGDYAGGFAVLAAALRAVRADGYPAVARHYAWRRATCPLATQRNGEEADAVVQTVIGQLPTPTADDLTIVAAAAAARGAFAQASATIAGALAAGAPANPAAAARLQAQAAAYARAEVWTETVRLPAS